MPLRRGQAGSLFSSWSRPPEVRPALGPFILLLCPDLPPHPGAWCPIHDLRGGKRLPRSGPRCGGLRGRGLGGPMWPDSAAAGWGGCLTCLDSSQEPPGPGGPSRVVARPQDPGRLAAGCGWGRGSLAGPRVASKFRNLITEWPRKGRERRVLAQDRLGLGTAGCARWRCV